MGMASVGLTLGGVSFGAVCLQHKLLTIRMKSLDDGRVLSLAKAGQVSGSCKQHLLRCRWCLETNQSAQAWTPWNCTTLPSSWRG